MDRYMFFDEFVIELSGKVKRILLYINGIADLYDKQTRIIDVQPLVLSPTEYRISVRANTNETLPSNVQ